MRYTCQKCKSEYVDPTIKEGEVFKKCMVCGARINIKNISKNINKKIK
jgi:DNA-directed RNA polymerase subunit RPC12/RpoP